MRMRCEINRISYSIFCFILSQIVFIENTKLCFANATGSAGLMFQKVPQYHQTNVVMETFSAPTLLHCSQKCLLQCACEGFTWTIGGSAICTLRSEVKCILGNMANCVPSPQSYFEKVGLISCSVVMNLGCGATDQTYALNLPPRPWPAVEIHCHGMDTVYPQEYISLVSNSWFRYSNWYTEGGAEKKECSYTAYTKVAIDPTTLKVIPDQTQYAQDKTAASSSYNSTGLGEYGKSAGCSSKCTCGTGFFKIDLRSTNFHLPIYMYFLRTGPNARITGCNFYTNYWWWGSDCGGGGTWKVKLTRTSTKYSFLSHDGDCSQLHAYNADNREGIWFEMDDIS